MSQRDQLVETRSRMVQHLRSALRQLEKAEKAHADARASLEALRAALQTVLDGRAVLSVREEHLAATHTRARKMPARVHSAMRRAKEALEKSIAQVQATTLTQGERALAQRQRAATPPGSKPPRGRTKS